VHRGHWFKDTSIGVCVVCGEDDIGLLVAGAGADGKEEALRRFDRAAIAALTTCTRGGLIPQARHGGNGVRSFAVLGSKFDGTGFENEQMGHIQVAFGSLTGAGEGAVARPGVAYRLGGVDPSGLLGPG